MLGFSGFAEPTEGPQTVDVNPVRRLLLVACSLVALQAAAETVMLRRVGNPAVVTFEYITQDELTILVKRVDGDAVLTYKWEELDQEWIKQNNPQLWAERKQLLEMANPEKAAKPAKDEDPFAQEATATDSRSLLRNLQFALQDGLRGLPLNATPVDVICAEFSLEENLFWLGFEELKTASRSRPAAVASEPAAVTAEESKDANPKSKTKGRGPAKSKVRTPESIAAEATARRDYENNAKPYTPLGYLRILAEGGTKAKPIWMMLRRSAADRESIKANLARFAALAGELAEKPEGKASKSELLVLKKALENCAESVGKVTRDTAAVEARLATDCRGLLSLVQR